MFSVSVCILHGRLCINDENYEEHLRRTSDGSGRKRKTTVGYSFSDVEWKMNCSGVDTLSFRIFGVDLRDYLRYFIHLRSISFVSLFLHNDMK